MIKLTEEQKKANLSKYAKTYYQANKKHLKATSLAYYYANKEKIFEWRSENRVKLNKYNRDYNRMKRAEAKNETV